MKNKNKSDLADLEGWIPFFMTNEEWFRRVSDENGSRLELTDKAPKKAIESYKRFYTDHYSKDGRLTMY